MSVTVMAALLGCCVQSIGRKSIFNLAGVAQAVAGNAALLSFVSLTTGAMTKLAARAPRKPSFPRETLKRRAMRRLTRKGISSSPALLQRTKSSSSRDHFCASLSAYAFYSAGLLYLFGMILYPAGWGAERVQRICGPEADAFYLANCSLGKLKIESFNITRVEKSHFAFCDRDSFLLA